TFARLALEIWEVIKNEDWVLTANTLKQQVRKLWDFDKPYRHPGVELGTSTQIGISLGVALAHKGTGRVVVDIQPDGDLMFDAGALWIAAKYQIPMLVVMHNNRAYYNDWEHQIRMAKLRGTDESKAHIGMDLFGPEPDFGALARAMGCYGEGPIDKPQEVRPALLRALAEVKKGRLALVDTVTQHRGYATCGQSRRLQTVLVEQSRGFRRHEFEQRRGETQILRRRQYAAREGRDLLQRLGQRADDLDAGDRQKLADLLDADLSVTLGDDLTHRSAGIRHDDFRFHLLGDAETRQHGGKVDAALTGLGVGKRLRRQKRAFQRVRRSNVRPLGALAHRHADAGSGEIDAAAGNRLAPIDKLINCLGRQDGDIAAGATPEVLYEGVGGSPGHCKFRTASALECREQVEHHRLYAVGAENLHRGDPFIFLQSLRVDASRAMMPLLSA